MPPEAAQRWTNRSLLAWMRETFESRSIDEPRLSAELLLEHATGESRMRLYTHADRPASDTELTALRAMVKRTLAGEPVQYVLGEWSFFGQTLKVDRRALIPRPCTEIICEQALQHARTRDTSAPLLVADIGTGAGTIALAVLANLDNAEAIATDPSADALQLAQENADRLNLAERVHFAQGEGLETATRHPRAEQHAGFDYILSNPPYIPDDEWNDPAMVDRIVRDHEPELALRGGPDGMQIAGPIIDAAPNALRPGGMLAIEVAASRADDAANRAEHAGLRDVRIAKDLDNLPRVIIAFHPA